MRKVVILFFACVSALWAAEAKPTLKIGALIPLTGDQASIGQEMRDGIKLALDEFPATAVDYKLVYEDNQNSLVVTNKAVRKLADFDKVDVVYSMWTPCADLIAPYTDEKQIIHFSISWDAKATEKYRYTLVDGPSLEGFAQKAVEIIKLKNCKRIALASAIEQGTNQVMKKAEELLKKEGLEVVFKEQVNPAERDFRGYILKINQAKPDAVIEIFVAPQIDIFSRQANELGSHWPVHVGLWDYCAPETLKLVEGNPYPSDIWTGSAFKERFKKQYGYDLKTYAGHIYDITKIVIQTTEAFYATNHQLPSHSELLALFKAPRPLPNLVTGPGLVHESGWMEIPFVIRQIKDGKAVDWQP